MGGLKRVRCVRANWFVDRSSNDAGAKTTAGRRRFHVPGSRRDNDIFVGQEVLEDYLLNGTRLVGAGRSQVAAVSIRRFHRHGRHELLL